MKRDGGVGRGGTRSTADLSCRLSAIGGLPMGRERIQERGTRERGIIVKTHKRYYREIMHESNNNIVVHVKKKFQTKIFASLCL